MQKTMMGVRGKKCLLPPGAPTADQDVMGWV
jgi:hypothetical protein